MIVYIWIYYTFYCMLSMHSEQHAVSLYVKNHKYTIFTKINLKIIFYIIIMTILPSKCRDLEKDYKSNGNYVLTL